MSEPLVLDTEERGRRLVRVLAVLAPERGDAKVAAYGAASLMPAWLAYIMTCMIDCGTDSVWRSVIGRCATLASRFHVLLREDWDRLDWTVRRIAVERASAFAGTATAAIERVLELLRRAERGDTVSPEERAAAMDALSRSHDTERPMDAAYWASSAAEWAMYFEKERSALEAMNSAAFAAAEARGGSVEIAKAVYQAMTDAITAAILDAIEAAIVAREAARG